MDATYNNYSYLESGSFFIISNGFHDMGQIAVVTTFQNQDLASHNAGIPNHAHFLFRSSGKISTLMRRLLTGLLQHYYQRQKKNLNAVIN
jgi:hypothetical protein